MKESNHIIWLCTVEFLTVFKNIYYDNVPINLPLLREFQKYCKRNDKSAFYWKKNTPLQKQIHTACEPFLINEHPRIQQEKKLLVRSNLYPLTRHFKHHQCVYLAHHKKEYAKARKNKGCRPLVYLPHVPQAKINKIKELSVQKKLNKIFKSKTTPSFFRTKIFRRWMRKNTKILLRNIRKVDTLFKKYSITKVLYGSTINRHGALIATFAQSRNIKSINFQHGILGEIGHLPVNADLNLVWGKSHRDYLESFGAPSRKIKIVPPIVIGRNYLNSPNRQKECALQKTEPIKILIALQPLGLRFNRTMIRHIENAAKRFPGKIFIHYKLHPDQKRNNYATLIHSAHAKLYSHEATTLQNLMKWCHFIITPYSTVAYEGFLCKKPVVFYGSPTHFYYLKGNPKFISSAADTNQLFLQLVKKPSYLATLSRQTSLKDKVEPFPISPLIIENKLSN